MIDPAHPIAKLLKEDRRYTLEAYVLVFESLKYAHEVLGLGGEGRAEGEEDDPTDEAKVAERHLSGQQLCESIRLFSLEQYGYMAQAVLERWGIRSTSDFGEIVYNLIGIGQMRKTGEDRREHFDNVFDFDTGFSKSFKITLPEA